MRRSPRAAMDDREALELGRAETARLCRGCTTCCTYVTVEVDPPRAAWEYDQWLWALHHRGVELYVDRPERWSLHFATRCAELERDGRCRIHGRHPVMCREHDPRSCERWLPLSDTRAWFRTRRRAGGLAPRGAPRPLAPPARLAPRPRARAPPRAPRPHGGHPRSRLRFHSAIRLSASSGVSRSRSIPRSASTTGCGAASKSGSCAGRDGRAPAAPPRRRLQVLDRPLALQLGQHLARPGQHALGQPGQPGDVDAVGAVGRAVGDAVQEHDASRPTRPP